VGAVIRVARSRLQESVHEADVAVVSAEGDLVASAGDPDRMLFARSSMKPLQAAVSLSLMAFDHTDEQLALMCASHSSEPVHLAVVRSLLARAGLSEDDLQCPPQRPWDDTTLAADPTMRRINSDCSGKHAGMLAASAAQGWPLDTYREPGHPVQQAVLEAVLSATGLGQVHVGVDGCGVPVHGMPLRRMALIYARLARPERLGDLEPFGRRAVGAMRAHPYLVAGRGRVGTLLMQAAPHLVAKGGAEALMSVSVPDHGWGMAVKVRDGGFRAVGPAVVAVLGGLSLLDPSQRLALEEVARPPVLGGGRRVGELIAEVSLERP